MKVNLASTRLAFILIAAVFLTILLSAIIPQIDIAQDQIVDLKETLGSGYKIIETLRLDRVYTTPFFFMLLGLLAINLTAGNIKRFKTIARAKRVTDKIRHSGSVIFHFSLIIIMSGVILNYLYKNHQVLALTEKQEVTDTNKSYLRHFHGPLAKTESGRFAIRLDSVDTEFAVEQSTTDAAWVTVWPRESIKPVISNIRVNNPCKLEDIEFHFGAAIGYSPKLLLLKDTNKTIFSSFVRIASSKSKEKETHRDYIMIAEHDLKIELEVISDTLAGEMFALDVFAQETILYSDTISMNDTAHFVDYQLTIPSLRRWCYIEVINNPFLNLIFFGFWASLVGLTVGFLPRVISMEKR